MQRVADALRHQLVVILHIDRDIPLVLLQPAEMTSHVPLGNVAFPTLRGVYLEPAVSPLEPLWKCVGFVQSPNLYALLIERSQTTRGWGQSHYRHSFLSFAQLTQFGGGLRVLGRQYFCHVFPNDQGFVVIGLAVINPTHNPNCHPAGWAMGAVVLATHEHWDGLAHR